MQESNANNLVATNTNNLTISYLAGENEVISCSYDICI